MDKNNPKYESIKAKLLKLQALAEKGCAGEARNARLAIERLCAQYGITLADLLDEDAQPQWYRFEIGRLKYLLTLFAQCYYKVTNTKEMSYKHGAARNVVQVKLTPIQYAELASLFTWHKANFLRELQAMQDTLVSAYVSKHGLYRERMLEDSESEKEEKPLTPAELQRIKRILAMREGLSDATYQKLLEQASGK